MEKQLCRVDYKVVHTILGRIRISVPRLKWDAEYASKLKQLVESLNFVTGVRINPAAYSIIVHYTDTANQPGVVREQLDSCIQNASLASHPVNPTSTKATIKPEADLTKLTDHHDSHRPVSQEKEIREVRETEPTTSSSTAAQTEILSKADIRLKQHDLAKRLKVTSQAITAHRTKPDFINWSQTHDPEGVAWKYDRISSSFYRVEQPSDKVKQSDPQPDDRREKIAKDEAEGEFIGKTSGELVGELVGDVVGDLLLGPVGGILAAEMVAKVGESVGESLGKKIVDTVEHIPEEQKEGHNDEHGKEG